MKVGFCLFCCYLGLLGNCCGMMGAVPITSWYPILNGSHFGLQPSSVHSMTGLCGKFVWNTTYPHKPYCCMWPSNAPRLTSAPCLSNAPCLTWDSVWWSYSEKLWVTGHLAIIPVCCHVLVFMRNSSPVTVLWRKLSGLPEHHNEAEFWPLKLKLKRSHWSHNLAIEADCGWAQAMSKPLRLALCHYSCFVRLALLGRFASCQANFANVLPVSYMYNRGMEDLQSDLTPWTIQDWTCD